MDSESGGGKTTLYIVVFFLCVISMLSGYFYYAMGNSEAEAQKKVAEIQAKADREMAEAKSAAEKDKIASEAAIQAANAKLQAESAANASKIKLQNEALAKSKAKLQSDLAAAAKAIKEANALKLTANEAKAVADKKAAEATSAIQKAQKSGKENEEKLAAEKKKLADEAAAQVAEAEKKAAQAIEAAKKEAQAVIELKQRLDSAETKLKQGAVASATVQGQPVRLEKATAVQGEALQKPKGDTVPVKISSFVFMRTGGYGKNKRYKIVEAPCYSYTCRENAASRTLQLVRFKGKGPDQFLIQSESGGLCRWDGVKGVANNLFVCDLNNVSLEEAYDKKAVFTGKRMPANFAAPPGIKIDKIRNQIVHLAGVKQDGGLRYCAHSRYSNAFRCDYDQPSAGNMFRITAIR